MSQVIFVLVTQKFPQNTQIFVNDGNATFEDMLKLINYVKTEVKKKGISLDLELSIK